MSRLMLLTGLLASFAAPSLLVANDSSTATHFQEIVNFVEAHLQGKTLEAKVNSKISDGSLETEFHRKTMYTNLVRTDDAATFDAVTLIRQQLWDLDASGERVSEEPRVKDRVLVIRYGFHPSKATGNAIGTTSLVTSSISPTPGQGSAIQLRMDSGKLIIVQSTPLYFDAFAQGDNYTPAASTDTTTFSMTDDKLVAETVEKGFDVDPDTLERTPNEHEVKLNESEIPGLF